MTLGITLLLLFLPTIAIFIALNFTQASQFLSNALSVFGSVPDVAEDLWSLLPSGVTQLILAIFIISLSVGLMQRILGGNR